MAAARVEDAAREHDAGRKLADEAAADASRIGWVGVGLEARLVSAEIRMRSNETAASAAGLQALAVEARSRGYGRLARIAEEAGRVASSAAP